MAILLFWSTDGNYVIADLELEEDREVETQVQDFCIEHQVSEDEDWISFIDIHGTLQMLDTDHIIRMTVESDEKRVNLFKLKVETLDYVV